MTRRAYNYTPLHPDCRGVQLNALVLFPTRRAINRTLPCPPYQGGEERPPCQRNKTESPPDKWDLGVPAVRSTDWSKGACSLVHKELCRQNPATTTECGRPPVAPTKWVATCRGKFMNCPYNTLPAKGFGNDKPLHVGVSVYRGGVSPP